MDSLKETEMEENEAREESPDKASQSGLLENLRTKRSWQIGAVVFLVLAWLFLSFVSSLGQKKEAGRVPVKTGEEKREVFKERDLAKAVSPEALSRESPRSELERQKREKRNYATEIAVFLFKEKEAKESPRVSRRRVNPKLGLPAGTKIQAYTSGTIFSFNVASPATAIISKDMEKDGVVIIPKDSKFLGEVAILKSLNRVNVNFDLLIFPDGREVKVRAMALSEDGSSGIKGRVNKHRDMRVLKALGETVLGGAAIFGRGGVSRDPYSLEDRFRENAFDNLTGMAREDLRNVRTDASITVESFTPIQVILLEAI